MNEQCTNHEIQLNDMEVLYPNQERYETEDKEMLIAMLKDKDSLIKRLWFELKATREQEQLWKECAGKLEAKTTTNVSEHLTYKQ